MPHISIKLWPGRTEAKKVELSERITQQVVSVFDVGEEYVSVSMEEIDREDWTKEVYEPEILGGPGKLYKKPGYDPYK